VVIKKSKSTKKKSTIKLKQDPQFKIKLIEESLLRLEEAKKRGKSKVIENKEPIENIVNQFNTEINILKYKKYRSLKEKERLIDSLFIYYNSNMEFKEYCKRNAISQYFIKYHRDEDSFSRLLH